VDPVPGRLVGERYRLERKLAEGGMGEVWVATHLSLDVPVAIKFMRRSASAGRARFEREARAAARLQSPYVVRAFDYGFDADVPFLAMELLSGESLEAKLQREGALSLEASARILRQIAKGLTEAHAIGIVHRDIKPANLFVARAGDEEVVKILDFGIAKEMGSPLVDDKTQRGTMLGSPHHMSPEQARGADVDARSDLWSVGVVLFRMLTGKRPFSGVNEGDVIAKICSDDLPRPDPSHGPEIEAFFARALARNPALRFQNALEMARAFDEAVGLAARGSPTDVAASTDEPVVARAEATLEESPASLPPAPPLELDARPPSEGSTVSIASFSQPSARGPRRAVAIASAVALSLSAAYLVYARSTRSAAQGDLTTSANGPGAAQVAAPPVTEASAVAPPASVARPADASAAAPAPQIRPTAQPARPRSPAAAKTTPRTTPSTNNPFF
jgi:eukaryotic-like serine/threonine-protein kinase